MDLNADLAEGFGVYRLGDDKALMGIITSANVAAGFHAGDPTAIRAACRMAAEHDVVVGAQVSYRDLAGFGRVDMAVPRGRLTDEILYQLAAVDGVARSCGIRASYLKPHGALYHAAAARPDPALALVEAVTAYDRGICVLGRPGSDLAAACAAAGLRFVAEGFADRRYAPDGSLVARSEPDAVLTDVREVVGQALGLARDRQVATGGGRRVDVAVDSICLHGDTPGAVELARAVRAALEEAGVPLAAFAAG